MDTKKRYLSKTVRSQIISFACIALSATGIIKVDDVLQGDILSEIVAIIAVVTQGMSIYFRIKAATKLTV